MRLAVDTAPLRASRDLRLLLGGEFVTGLGTQAALVAVPYQMYTETHSPFLTGLLGAVELGPLIGASLVSGALADRLDRRRLLLAVQIALVATASTLAAVSFAGHPPVPLLFVLAALLAAFGGSRTSRGRRSSPSSSIRRSCGRRSRSTTGCRR